MMCELISEKRPENEQKVPFGENGEDGSNWYAYVGNDPVNLIDPTGLESADAAYSWLMVREIWDPITVDKIEQLHPNIRADAKEMILNLQDENINLRITSGMRTIKEQNELYQSGRNEEGEITDRSEVVTNVKGGSSYHNYGLAFDVVEIDEGKALWSNENWDKIGEAGKEQGFEWGGDWEDFPDKPHFQQTYGYSTSELNNMYQSGKADESGYLRIKNK